jgi:hypothetical protein
MQENYTEELNELALEFKSMRDTGERRFPESLWQKTIAIIKTTPIGKVSTAIAVPVPYLRKKIREFSGNTKPLRFVEAIPQTQMSSCGFTISVATPNGNMMKIEGATEASLNLLVSVFLKEGSLCSK